MRGAFFSSSPSPKAMGRGTARRAVEGPGACKRPSTVLRTVPLPMSFAHGEDELRPPPHGLTPISQASAPRAVCIRFSAWSQIAL